MSRRAKWMICVLGLAMAMASTALHAQQEQANGKLRLPAVFGDNMVLQRNAPLPVWGWAQAGQEVTVSFLGQKKSAKAGADGKWMVKLDPVASGGPSEFTVSAGETTTFKNVVVGEVWICSGQSNMQWALNQSQNWEQAAASSANPQLRLFHVERIPAEKPVDDLKAKWTESNPQTTPGFSAVAYYFGQKLQKELGVPVGLIHTSWGGTSIYLWINKDVMDTDPELKAYNDQQGQRNAAQQANLKRWQEADRHWQKAAAQARAEGWPVPPRAQRPGGNAMGPAVLYNGMIHPIVPFAVGGAIWYQGESNAGQAKWYRRHLPMLIENWRKEFGSEFPFLVVQLANFMERKTEPTDTAWAELREAQLKTIQSVPKTGMAVIIDIGEAKDIHPRNKKDVGERLALNALAIAYKKDIVYSGPIYKSMKVEGDKVRLTFDHVGGGLVAKGGELKGFAVAGEDKKFHWADAKIDGDTIVVSSPNVAKPVAVRYAWADNPEATLYNKAELPASPFRTDEWVRGQ